MFDMRVAGKYVKEGFPWSYPREFIGFPAFPPCTGTIPKPWLYGNGADERGRGGGGGERNENSYRERDTHRERSRVKEREKVRRCVGGSSSLGRSEDTPG